MRVIIDVARVHLQMRAGIGHLVARTADHDAAAVTRAVERRAERVMAVVALADVRDRVGGQRDELAGGQVDRLGHRVDRHHLAADGQARQHRHLRLLDRAGRDQRRDGADRRRARRRRLGRGRLRVLREVEVHFPLAGRTGGDFREQRVVVGDGRGGVGAHGVLEAAACECRRTRLALVEAAITRVGADVEVLRVVAVERHGHRRNRRGVGGTELDVQDVRGLVERHAVHRGLVERVVLLARCVVDHRVVALVVRGELATDAIRLVAGRAVVGDLVERDACFRPQLLEGRRTLALRVALRREVGLAVRQRVRAHRAPRALALDRMAALAGLGREVLVGQDLVELARMAGRAVGHRLWIRELHGMRHVRVVHDVRVIVVLHRIRRDARRP